MIWIRIAASATILSAVIAAVVLLPRVWVGPILYGMAVVVSVSVLLTFASVAWEGMTTRKYERYHQLVLGIWITWATFLGLEIWPVIARLLALPTGLAMSPVVKALIALTIIGGLLHRTAPNVGKEKRWWTWWQIPVILALGTALGVGLVVASRNGWLGPPQTIGVPPAGGPQRAVQGS